METIKIDWENCFGIGKLNHEFNFNTQNSNSFMIYAPNGTMKTSFAKTFDLVSKNEPNNMPCDRVHANKISKYVIFSDGIAIKPENILLDNNKIEILKAAIEVLSDWQEELEKDGLINYY